GRSVDRYGEYVKSGADQTRRRWSRPRRRTRLGLGPRRTHNRSMEIRSDNPEHGFQFPGTFEITAMGPATAGLETEIPKLLTAAGIDVLHETISWRESSGGKFVSVKL